jgi:recombinational DNA repair protein RecT
LIDLARRSGQISMIYAYPVREQDRFEWKLGLNPDIIHEPAADVVPDRQGKDITHVYAVGKLVDGGTQFIVMTRHEVEAVRARSKAKNNGPWVTDWEAMALKTAIKRLVKYLPMSIELADALAADTSDPAPNEFVDGMKNIEGEVVDGTTEVALPPSQTEQTKAELKGRKRKPKAKEEPKPQPEAETDTEQGPENETTQRLEEMVAASKDADEETLDKFCVAAVKMMEDAYGPKILGTMARETAMDLDDLASYPAKDRRTFLEQVREHGRRVASLRVR